MTVYRNEFVLTVDGCPTKFATAGLSSVTSTDPDWPTSGTLVTNTLGYRDYKISEHIRPIDGSLDVGGLSFTLHDPPYTVDGQLAARGTTMLGTRTVANITSTELDLSTSGIDTATSLSFTVASSSGLPASGVLWVDAEAILFDSIAGNVVTVNASGRGYYGSRAVPHLTDPTVSYSPAVFASFPDFAKRRVVFWIADEDNVMHRLWAGYVIRSIRALPGTASYELECESAWSVSRAFPLAIPGATCRTRGFLIGAINAAVTWPSLNRMFPIMYHDTALPYADDLAGALAAFAATMRAEFTRESFSATLQLTEVRGGVALSITSNQLDGGGLDTLAVTARLQIGNLSCTDTSVESANPRHATPTVTPVPSALHAFGPASPLRPGELTGVESYLVDNTAGFPASWAATTINDGSVYTTIQPVLRGKLGDDLYVIIEPTSCTDEGVITGTSRVEYGDGSEAPQFIASEPVELKLVNRVETNHWVYGIRRALVEDTTFIASGADSRDWDWSQLFAVVGATSGGSNARAWYLDGSLTLEKILADLLKLNGCALGMRGGKMSPFAFRPPIATDVPTLTIVAETDLAVDTVPGWNPLDEGIANVVRIDTGANQLFVRDQRSIARFGPGKQVDLALLGEGELRVLSPHSPADLVQYVLRRIIGMWSTPTSLVSYQLSIARLFLAYLGDFVSCTDWTTPDGAGGRGISGQVGQCTGRELDIPVDGAASMALDVLLYGKSRLAGYAPAVRLADITAKACTVAIIYLGVGGLSETSDYAGSNLASYSGTANDGGVGKIIAGDKLRLVERDNVTPRTPEDVTVTSVAAGVVNVTPAPNVAWQAIIAGGGMVDLVPQTFSALTDHQKLYAAVADRATGLIDATNTTAFVWAP